MNSSLFIIEYFIHDTPKAFDEQRGGLALGMLRCRHRHYSQVPS